MFAVRLVNTWILVIDNTPVANIVYILVDSLRKLHVFVNVSSINCGSLLLQSASGLCSASEQARERDSSSVVVIGTCQFVIYVSIISRRWRQEGGGKGSILPGRQGGGIWRGKNMEFWNLAASGELAFALQDGFSGFVSIAGYIHNFITTQTRAESVSSSFLFGSCNWSA